MKLLQLDAGISSGTSVSRRPTAVLPSRVPPHSRVTTKSALPAASLDQLFRQARTYNEWSSRDVDDQTVHALYDLLKWAPTASNSSPARFVWVKSAEGKAKLAALAMGANQPKILAAPVTVIIGYDLAFPETMPRLFPARGEQMRAYFEQPGMAEETAKRNSSLQGAYLILAARAGSRLRTHVRLRQGGCRSRVFCRHTYPIQFHLQPWIWKTRHTVSAQPTAVVRRRRPVGMNGCCHRSRRTV